MPQLIPLDTGTAPADYISQGTLEARPHHRLQVSRTPETATWHALMHRYTERLGEKFGLTHAVKAKVSAEEHDHVKRYLLAPGSLNGEVAFDANMQDEVRCIWCTSCIVHAC